MKHSYTSNDTVYILIMWMLCKHVSKFCMYYPSTTQGNKNKKQWKFWKMLKINPRKTINKESWKLFTWVRFPSHLFMYVLFLSVRLICSLFTHISVVYGEYICLICTKMPMNEYEWVILLKICAVVCIRSLQVHKVSPMW